MKASAEARTTSNHFDEEEKKKSLKKTFLGKSTGCKLMKNFDMLLTLYLFDKKKNN